jgi:hypothetical protein
MRKGAAVLLMAGVTLAPARAQAYRPFDGTDADVAETGRFELELGPQWYYEGGDGPLRGHHLVAPSTVFNLGVVRGTELVLDFDDYVALGPLDGRPPVALLNTDFKVKHVFREGSVQGGSGPSVAVEAGPLLPEIGGANRWGATLDLLVSYEWEGGAVHFNAWPSYNRADSIELIADVIVEGPRRWAVRPVSEVFYDRDLAGPESESVLVGAIWEVKDFLALDAGLRGAHVGQDHAAEARLGFTWTFPVWQAR